MRFAATAACALGLIACGAPPPSPGRGEGGEGGEGAGLLTQAPEAAREAVQRGDTREAVRARLGDAAVARFASGYDVWVYRFPATRQARDRDAPADRRTEMAELVLLFSPQGMLAKARLRPAGG